MTIEILKLIASFLTPIVILFLGLLINRNLERNKITLLQEKEWQFRWAETFLNRAIQFDENISALVTSLCQLQDESKKLNQDDEKQNELLKTINQHIANIQYLDWDIQNFAQFAENGIDVINKQKQLTTGIKDIFDKKQGDLEHIRNTQFEYNKLVRLAHNQILKAKAKT